MDAGPQRDGTGGARCRSLRACLRRHGYRSDDYLRLDTGPCVERPAVHLGADIHFRAYCFARGRIGPGHYRGEYCHAHWWGGHGRDPGDAGGKRDVCSRDAGKPVVRSRCGPARQHRLRPDPRFRSDRQRQPTAHVQPGPGCGDKPGYAWPSCLRRRRLLVFLLRGKPVGANRSDRLRQCRSIAAVLVNRKSYGSDSA